jgi:hypothetical protein
MAPKTIGPTNRTAVIYERIIRKTFTVWQLHILDLKSIRKGKPWSKLRTWAYGTATRARAWVPHDSIPRNAIDKASRPRAGEEIGQQTTSTHPASQHRTTKKLNNFQKSFPFSHQDNEKGNHLGAWKSGTHEIKTKTVDR